MNMIVVVMASTATLFAKCIYNRIVWCRDGMYNPFVYKGLKGSINGNAVKIFSYMIFNIRVCECRIFLKKTL
jgi:hypothetical protein